MLLEVTVVCGTGVGPAAADLQPAELSITWPAGATPSGLSLEQALSLRWAGRSFSVAGERLAGLSPGTPPLVNGAVVVSWPAGAAPRLAAPQQERRSVAVLVVASGPAAGAVFELRRGRYTIGRGRCRITIADPAMSRHHCTLEVGSRNITLTAAPGSSGMVLHRVDGVSGGDARRSCGRGSGRHATAGAVPVRGVMAVEVGQVVACGSSTLELRFQDQRVFQPAARGSAGTATVAPGGRANAGTPNAATPGGAAAGAGGGAGPGGVPGSICGPWPSGLLDPAVLSPLEVENPAGTARGKTATALAVGLPIAFGVGLALLTGSWMFLSFAAMGAVAAVVPLCGGSARRRTLREAVAMAARQDARRLVHAFPDAGTLLLAAHSGAPGPPARPPTAGVAVRLGTSEGPAGVSLTPREPSFSPPLQAFRPACIRLDAASTGVSGPKGPVKSLLNYILMQLDAAAVPVVLLGPAAELPLTARLLPYTVLATSTGSALRALGPRAQGADAATPDVSAVLLVLGLSLDARLMELPGVAVLQFSADADGLEGPGMSFSAAPGSVVLRAAGNSILGTASGRDFVPDGVPDTVFAAHARRRALAGPAWGPCPGRDGHVPAPEHALEANSLPTPEDGSTGAVRTRWALAAGRPLGPVPIGRSATGPVMFDFLRDGPHLLLGGTTGSGKSEFLRTLVGSLAAAHSPADLQFVFLDFKGGAGLGVLGGLPHTSSLITDLGGHEMDRTLASLRAELHRREEALAAARVSDSDEYRAWALAHSGPQELYAHALAHLVVVIDEFRILVDQFPDAMAELMRIAAVGRSLGIHLVMATQRPQGAVNADIRANVTSSICLRVQSPLDSMDVIGTGAASAIAVTTPGRAFISRAGGGPEEFQSATLHLPADADSPLPLVEAAAGRLAGAALPQSAGAGTGSDAAGVALLMDRAWQEARAEAGHRARPAAPAVIASQLPAVLEPGAAGPGGGAVSAVSAEGHSLLLGMVDVPQGQCLAPLAWSPAGQSHLAFFGTVPETSRAVALVAGQLAGATAQHPSPEDAALVYLLDGEGSLAPYAASPWTGACLHPGQLRTAAHLLQRLAQTVPGSPRQHILCVTDWGRWASALRSSPWHGSEDDLSELVRFSPPNLAVAVGGGRELLSATFLPAIPNRMFLSHGSNVESTMLWPRLPRFKPLQGRGAIAGPINAFSGPGLGPADGELHIAQLGRPPACGARAGGSDGTEGFPSRDAGAAAEFLRVQELPSRLGMADMPAMAGPHPPRAARGTGTGLLLGVGGDGRDPVVAVLAPGRVLPVIGGAGAGKSCFIRAVKLLNGHRPVAEAPQGGDGAQGAGGPGGILWLDDAASLAPRELLDATRHLAAGGSVVAAFDYPGPALSTLPLEWGLRTAQQGVVLAPQRAGDAELFGVRLDTSGAEPPGRAVLLDRGRCRWFQFPLDGVPS